MAEEDSLFREVDEAIRHDKLMAAWRKYRMPLLAASLALIVATAGGSMWSAYQQKRAGESMQQFSIAQEQYAAGDFNTAADSFGITADIALKGDLRDMAQLWEARALEKAGKEKAAIKQLVELAEKPAGDDLLWRDLACLRLAAIDSAKAATCLDAGASPLDAERALVRASTLWEAGKADKAAALLQMLVSDADTNDSVRARAQQYLSAVKSDAKS